MSILLLFALGAALGVLANFLVRAQAHQHKFNNVSAGIIGALFGGALLPRLFGWRDVSPNGIDIPALLLAALGAAILLTILTVLRNRFGR